MSKELMILDAWKSMNEHLVGFLWDVIKSEVRRGEVTAIYPDTFESDEFTWCNFSFIDPRLHEAPPKGTLVLVRYKGSIGWCAHFSTGRFDSDGYLITVPIANELKFEDKNEATIGEWRLPDKGMVPEDLL